MGRTEKNIDDIYLTICKDLLHAPKVGNTRELRDVKLVLTDISNNIVSVRDISPSYLFGELLWYFTGKNDVEFIAKFSKMWERLSDDDVTNNSAYGFLMKYAHEFDQIEKMIELLQHDPESRRAVINLNTPNPWVIETKDEPCTIALQFLIRNGKLYCTTMMRSNDIWFGLPYDIAFFTTLQKYIATRLDVEYGTYTHFVTSLHMYDRDAEQISKIVDDPTSKPINFNESAFFRNYDFLAGLVSHSRNPKEDVIQLFKDFNIYKEE